jgi:hypothetical protein
MTLEEIYQEIAKDFKIDQSNLGGEVIRITADMFVKYIRLYSQVKTKVELLQNRRKLLVAERRDYYSGNASADVYKAEPFDQVIKSETILQKFLDNDKKIVEYDDRIILEKQKLEVLQACVNEIKTLGFSIKTAIDDKKFMNGG